MARVRDDEDLAGDDDGGGEQHARVYLLPEHEAREDDVGDELDGALRVVVVVVVFRLC